MLIFLCPPSTKINGGVKCIFRMAEVLRAGGHDAVVFEKDRARPAWFKSDAPIVGPDSLAPSPDDILVFPEDQQDAMRSLADWPQRKVVYCQNHFYAALGALGADSFADFGVSHILCSSKTIADYCRLRHPGLPAHVVPCGVDPAVFKPAAKKSGIALIPRKRPVEAAYLQDLFPKLYPAWRDVPWRSLNNTSETELAAALGESAVFLSLSRLDGFGLTPIEAMAAGCVVAGFTGIGGREYATPQNGFWAEEDDFPACMAALDQALTLTQNGGAALTAYHQAAQATATQYTPDIFADAARVAWQDILKPG